ncbi:unannotated protein [freshwater metagenome]|uniref:Unannotated protein n=1 Tax=freshwater metagenome TaxID=449393 RepID=A0A6J6ETG2_9ZZZZ
MGGVSTTTRSKRSSLANSYSFSAAMYSWLPDSRLAMFT